MEELMETKTGQKIGSGSSSSMARLVAGMVFLLMLLVAGLAVASERGADEVSRITTRLSREIYSPYCPGKTLAMCPSAGAQNARMEIQELARTGMPESEIKSVMLGKFGEEYELVEPPAEDNMTLLGALFAGLSLAVVAVVVMTRRRRSEGGEEGSDDASDMANKEEGEEEDFYLEELRAEYLD